MIGLAGSAFAFLPLLLVITPDRRLMGMSVVTYTRASIVFAIAAAVILVVIALALPQS